MLVELVVASLVLAIIAGFFADATLYAAKLMKRVAREPKPRPRSLAPIDWSAEKRGGAPPADAATTADQESEPSADVTTADGGEPADADLRAQSATS